MNHSSTHSGPSRAVIAGASLAGLLSARAVAPSFDEVVLVDQNTLTNGAAPRRGVGQAHHSHVLMQGGLQAMESLLPGISFELRQAGPGTIDAAEDFRWYLQGAWRPRFRSQTRLLWCERARLDWIVRQRIAREIDLDIRGHHKVVGYRTSAGGKRVCGVDLCNGSTGDVDSLSADLVIDATGRASRTACWLAELGYPDVEVDTCRVGLGYTSGKFSRPANYDGGWSTLAIYPRPPHSTRMGVMYRLDDDRFHVTLGGWCGDHAPPAIDGFRQFAGRLEQPDLSEYLGRADRLSKLRVFNVPEARWRRYGRLARWPAGLLVMGDALANFNPVYGQGMSVCAMQARMLREMMRRRMRRGVGMQNSGPQALTCASFVHRIQQQASRIVSVPWMLASSMDRRFPDAGAGADGPLDDLVDWYISTVTDRAAADTAIHQRFLDVFTLTRSPLRLAEPAVLGSLFGT